MLVILIYASSFAILIRTGKCMILYGQDWETILLKAQELDEDDQVELGGRKLYETPDDRDNKRLPRGRV